MNSPATSNANLGFTLPELLIVLAIGVALLAAAAPIYGNLHLTADLNSLTMELEQNLRLVSTRAAGGWRGVRHGLYLNISPGGADSYTLYQGDSYPTRDGNYDQVVNLPPTVNLSFVLPTPDISFRRGSGLANSAGTIILAHQTWGTRTISLNQVGLIARE